VKALTPFIPSNQSQLISWTKYDAPVQASAVKLWLLELDAPIALWEGWEDLRRLYPDVGSAEKGEKEAVYEQEHLEALKGTLLRLLKVHFP